MTAKRFTIYGKEIIQDKQVWCMANSEHCADVIATAMNELYEENQELKRLIKVTVKDYTDLKKSFDLIDKENEQLQSLKEYLIELLEKNGATVEIEKVKMND